jgi:hypothetical protein
MVLFTTISAEGGSELDSVSVSAGMSNTVLVRPAAGCSTKRRTGSSSTVNSRNVLPRGQPNSNSNASDGSWMGLIDTTLTYTLPSASYWIEKTRLSKVSPRSRPNSLNIVGDATLTEILPSSSGDSVGSGILASNNWFKAEST